MLSQTLNRAQIDDLNSRLPEWAIVHQNGTCSLQRTFTFDDFIQALEFTIRVGDVAVEQKRYPKLMTENGRVTVCWGTDEIKSLHPNDFVMAAKTDHLYRQGLAIWKARRNRE